jgi:hypothetical protein
LTRAARLHAAAPTRLGLTLRSVLLAPRDGFGAALRTSERRARAGERPAEGYAPWVLGGLGGIAAMALWLKLSALGEARSVPAGSVDSGLVVAALLLGAVLSVAGQAAWGVLGPRVARRLGGAAHGRGLRLAWGAAALPQAGVLVLLPLDLLLVGPGAYATDPLVDPVARAWAALSIALSVSAALWSLWLFLRGVQIAAGTRMRRAAAIALAAPLSTAPAVGVIAVAGALVR